jgi:hypothetical protein
MTRVAASDVQYADGMRANTTDVGSIGQLVDKADVLDLGLDCLESVELGPEFAGGPGCTRRTIGCSPSAWTSCTGLRARTSYRFSAFRLRPGAAVKNCMLTEASFRQS